MVDNKIINKFVCERCGKGFKQRGHYKSHINRKFPCEIIDNSVNNNNNVNNNFIKTTLENNECYTLVKHKSKATGSLIQNATQ